jgi:energy-coupling factor transporter ATP-binding protein EcfA2
MSAAVHRRLADAWVVAGPPGAGKSTVAEHMLGVLAPTPALLDKDTLYGGFVAATLAAADRPDGEREGPWYDSHIKVHEYASLAITAREIREHGCPVLLCAPFTEQIRDATRWSTFVQEIGGGVVRLVWVQSNAAALRGRIVERGSTRDAQKLARFDEFVERMQPDEPPEIPHCFVVNNRSDAPESIEEQVRRLLATGS